MSPWAKSAHRIGFPCLLSAIGFPFRLLDISFLAIGFPLRLMDIDEEDLTPRLLPWAGFEKLLIFALFRIWQRGSLHPAVPCTVLSVLFRVENRLDHQRHPPLVLGVAAHPIDEPVDVTPVPGAQVLAVHAPEMEVIHGVRPLEILYGGQH